MLTTAQQATLDYHFRETNLLTNEELIQELTDHYANALPERMAQGRTFEESLADVQRDFGGRKELQKMERHYNRVTFRKYDSLWMQLIRKQGKWPHCLVPLFSYLLTYWATTHSERPASFSADVLANGLWMGFIVGSFVGLSLQFCRLVMQHGIRIKNVPYKASYLATRFLPIPVLLYGICALLIYINAWLPPFVYEATMSACAAIAVAYMMSYSQFYQAVFKH